MAALTLRAECAIRAAQGCAGESTDMIAFAIVNALEAVAHEIAALRETLEKSAQPVTYQPGCHTEDANVAAALATVASRATARRAGGL